MIESYGNSALKSWSLVRSNPICSLRLSIQDWSNWFDYHFVYCGSVVGLSQKLWVWSCFTVEKKIRFTSSNNHRSSIFNLWVWSWIFKCVFWIVHLKIICLYDVNYWKKIRPFFFIFFLQLQLLLINISSLNYQESNNETFVKLVLRDPKTELSMNFKLIN